MPRRKRCATPFEDFEEDYEDEVSSNGSRSHTQPPIQRNAANARERARMRVLSSAFCRLKTKLPWVPSDTKLSKLDTLRLATIYIQQLRASLSTEETSINNGNHSNSLQSTQSLVWPFSFQQNIDNRQQSSSSSSSCSNITNSNNNNNNNNNNLVLNQWLSSSRDSTDLLYKQTALNARANILSANSTAHG